MHRWYSFDKILKWLQVHDSDFFSPHHLIASNPRLWLGVFNTSMIRFIHLGDTWMCSNRSYSKCAPHKTHHSSLSQDFTESIAVWWTMLPKSTCWIYVYKHIYTVEINYTQPQRDSRSFGVLQIKDPPVLNTLGRHLLANLTHWWLGVFFLVRCSSIAFSPQRNVICPHETAL